MEKKSEMFTQIDRTFMEKTESFKEVPIKYFLLVNLLQQCWGILSSESMLNSECKIVNCDAAQGPWRGRQGTTKVHSTHYLRTMLDQIMVPKYHFSHFMAQNNVY